MSRFTRALRALLRGEEIEWDGGVMRMLHWEGYGARRPIEAPFVFAAGGPKGIAAARELGQGVFSAFAALPGFDWNVVLLVGTALEDGESPGSARAIAAAGHGGAVIFHYALEHRMLEMISGGEEWRQMYEAMPARTRHLAMHDGHLVGVNDNGRRFVTGEFLAKQGLALDRAAWRERLAKLEAEGATEAAFQPAGSDIPRELEAFASLTHA